MSMSIKGIREAIREMAERSRAEIEDSGLWLETGYCLYENSTEEERDRLDIDAVYLTSDNGTEPEEVGALSDNLSEMEEDLLKALVDMLEWQISDTGLTDAEKDALLDWDTTLQMMDTHAYIEAINELAPCTEIELIRGYREAEARMREERRGRK